MTPPAHNGTAAWTRRARGEGRFRTRPFGPVAAATRSPHGFAVDVPAGAGEEVFPPVGADVVVDPDAGLDVPDEVPVPVPVPVPVSVPVDDDVAGLEDVELVDDPDGELDVDVGVDEHGELGEPGEPGEPLPVPVGHGELGDVDGDVDGDVAFVGGGTVWSPWPWLPAGRPKYWPVCGS